MFTVLCFSQNEHVHSGMGLPVDDMSAVDYGSSC